MLRIFLSVSLALMAITAPLSGYAKGFEGFVAANADGTVTRGSKGFDVTHFATGQYEIDVPASVAKCAWSITVASSDSTTPPVGFAVTVSRDENPEAIMVSTYDTTDQLSDRGYNLIVRC